MYRAPSSQRQRCLAYRLLRNFSEKLNDVKPASMTRLSVLLDCLYAWGTHSTKGLRPLGNYEKPGERTKKPKPSVQVLDRGVVPFHVLSNVGLPAWKTVALQSLLDPECACDRERHKQSYLLLPASTLSHVCRPIRDVREAMGPFPRLTEDICVQNTGFKMNSASIFCTIFTTLELTI